jgi:hypothetical protein
MICDVAVARHGDQHAWPESWCRPKLPGHLIAIGSRQPDIADNDRRSVAQRRCNPGIAAVRDKHLVAHLLQIHCQHFGGIPIVFDDEHPLQPVTLQ